MNRFYFGLLIHVITGVSIRLSIITDLKIIFVPFAILSFLGGLIITQFSKKAQEEMDGTLLLILEVIIIVSSCQITAIIF